MTNNVLTKLDFTLKRKPKPIIKYEGGKKFFFPGEEQNRYLKREEVKTQVGQLRLPTMSTDASANTIKLMWLPWQRKQPSDIKARKQHRAQHTTTALSNISL